MAEKSPEEKALVEALGKECRTPAEVSAKLKELFAGTLETMLEAEMDDHLGYEKHSVQRVHPQIPQKNHIQAN